jgi:hypothetical protein
MTDFHEGDIVRLKNQNSFNGKWRGNLKITMVYNSNIVGPYNLRAKRVDGLEYEGVLCADELELVIGGSTQYMVVTSGNFVCVDTFWSEKDATDYIETHYKNIPDNVEVYVVKKLKTFSIEKKFVWK